MIQALKEKDNHKGGKGGGGEEEILRSKLST